ncbi:MAG: hypothetical protein ACRDGN_11345, partial [bacterium]
METLGRFERKIGEPWAEALAVHRYLADLQVCMKPISAHRHYRALRTIFAWATEGGLLSEDPLKGYHMRRAKTLPRVPEDEQVRQLLKACDPDTFEG